MSTPIVIIETRSGQLEALYSNTEIRFIIVDHDDRGKTRRHRPLHPTLEIQKLYQIVMEFCIQAGLMTAQLNSPYF